MNIRLRTLKRAKTYLGVHEVPPGSNLGPQIETWQLKATGSKGYPWCAAFLWNMFYDSGKALKIKYPASVLSWVNWATTLGFAKARPYMGDVVAYSWHGSTPHPEDHIGIIEKVLALPWKRNGRRFFIKTIEGNTGDSVRRRWRWVDPSTVVFIRVPD